MNEQRNLGLGGFRFIPPVIKTIMISNIIVYLLQNIVLQVFTIGGIPLSSYLIEYFALQPVNLPEQFFSAANFYPWQLISYQFLHGGFIHLFFNLFALWMFGSELETLWGGPRFITYYLLSGVGAGLFQLILAPMVGQYGPTIGASGAIYGVLLAYGLSFPDRSIFMFPIFIPIPAKIYVFIFMGLELYLGWSGGDGVAHLAHLGGGITGFFLLKFGDKLGLYRLVNRMFKKKSSLNEPRHYSRTYSEHTHKNIYTMDNTAQSKINYTPKQNKVSLNVNGEEITQAKIDEILDKISEKGYQSLTDKEKFILTELSKKI